MNIIFDLDQTLVNSSIAAILRDQRSWSQVYSKIKDFIIYDGVKESLDYLKEQKIPYCIVTASPSTYCHRVCEHWGIDYTNTVCFHDTARRKPFPDPIILAIQRMKADISKPIISFGDRKIDIEASNAANVISVACLWGSDNKIELVASKPTYVIESANEIIPLIETIRKTGK